MKDYSQFQFDLVMANPPFAGDIKENTIISHYELGKTVLVNGKTRLAVMCCLSSAT